MEKVIIGSDTLLNVVLEKDDRDKGFCVRCGQIRDAVYAQCASCRKMAAERKSQTKKKRIANGLCPTCGKHSLPNSQVCQKCYFYKVANVTLKNVNMSPAIAALFEEQDGRCAYTGETLILGVNASIDHKTPQCKGGGHNIENLQWVTKRINSNKFNLTHEEFVSECASIAAKFCHITACQVTPVEAPAFRHGE